MTLSPDASAALERSIAAVRGDQPATDASPRPGTPEWREQQEAPLAPLWFDGARHTRRPRRPQDDRQTATGDLLPSQLIGPGWTVFSLRLHGADGDGLGRSGICVDVEADDDGEAIYVCVAHWRNNVGRMVVPLGEVEEAVKASRAAIGALRSTVYRAMGDRPMGLVVLGDATWLGGAAVRLGGLAES